MSSSPAAFNHFGHCVTDIERAVRFYTELFGFAERRRMAVPDDPAAQLLGVDKPLGLEAAYLVKDGVTLELLTFRRPGNAAQRPRPFTEPGLTHMSFSVQDIDATAARAVELGGSLEAGSNVGAAVMIRDPDGQAIELIGTAHRSMPT